MICYETGLAAVLDAQLLANWATIAAPFIAISAISYAKRQLNASRADSRRATAYATYQSYLQLCFEHTTFARGNENDITRNQDDYERYKWFVAQMLFSFEQVLEACSGDDDTWEPTIKHQLKRHKWHLDKSGSASRPEWSKALKVLFP
ncbi:hypothetical protein L5L91_21850 [Shewanella sp. SM55]|uniref:hypothetical protein n=1 Tax=Shewanella sp. SM55 TaxID=2912800 RepID=UPI0021D98B75|nr:hypothetical protein [Shewanella sp. SM55]MCU8063389.1 hypothetical protein [Shewanella sp. SM55]